MSEARCVLREARGIYEQEQDRDGLAMVLETEARILLSEGRTKEAARCILRALAILRGTDRAPRIEEAQATYRAILEAQSVTNGTHVTIQHFFTRSISHVCSHCVS